MRSINMLRLVLKGKGHSASASPAEGAVAQLFRWDEALQESRLESNPATDHVDGFISIQMPDRLIVQVNIYKEIGAFFL